MDLSSSSLASRQLIMYSDLNMSGRLFGGKLLSWVDEGMCMLAMGAMNTTQIVTKKISEVNFQAPALLGDILEIWGEEFKCGKTSYTMKGRVIVKRESKEGMKVVEICNFNIVFVALDDNGKPVSWK